MVVSRFWRVRALKTVVFPELDNPMMPIFICLSPETIISQIHPLKGIPHLMRNPVFFWMLFIVLYCLKQFFTLSLRGRSDRGNLIVKDEIAELVPNPPKAERNLAPVCFGSASQLHSQ